MKISTFPKFEYFRLASFAFIFVIIATLFSSCSNNSLEPNKLLRVSEFLKSKNGRFKLLLQGDGNLVISDDKGEPMWASNTSGKPITKCTLQEDGNFVLKDDNNKSLWSSNTSGHLNTNLSLDNDGVLRIYQDNKIIWQSSEYANNFLEPNQLLKQSEFLKSKNGKFKLQLESDGNLVVYNDKKELLWVSNTIGKPVTKCVLQEDGNLVLYDDNNQPYWASNTSGNANAKLLLRLDDDGALRIYHENKVIWQSINNSLAPNKQLGPSEFLKSKNGKFKLLLQSDGNLVVYNDKNEPLWASNTSGKPVTKCVLQEDGNLVLYDNNFQPHWASNTSGYLKAKLLLQLEDDGQLRIYNENKVIWSTPQP